jgi:Cyclin M transmembrane N-terminal domain/Pyridoxal-phosphate dependent enzyme
MSYIPSVWIWFGIIACITLSALFAGLNLAIFSLSQLRLQLEADGGSKDAARVLDLRKNSNQVLATVIWGNVATNVFLTLLCDSVLAGLGAFFFSAVVITLFGEIAPQAYFSRNALRMTARLLPFLIFWRAALFFVARPTAILLDWWLGVASVWLWWGRKGYRIVLVVLNKMAREKILHCKAMGAGVVLTRSDVGRGYPDYYQDLAEATTARTPGALFIDQFANPANPQAHESTTGVEIFRQMQGSVDAVVVGVGSGGTLTGIGRYMAKNSPATRMILADPVGSVLAPFVESGRVGKAGSWAVEGIGRGLCARLMPISVSFTRPMRSPIRAWWAGSVRDVKNMLDKKSKM